MNPDVDSGKIEKLLEDIKKLLILQLYKLDTTTTEIGYALGVSYKTVERMLPTKRKKAANGKAKIKPPTH